MSATRIYSPILGKNIRHFWKTRQTNFFNANKYSLTCISLPFKLRLPRKVLYRISTVFTLPYFSSIAVISSNVIKPSELYETIIYRVSSRFISVSSERRAAFFLLNAERFQFCVIPETLLIGTSSLFLIIRFSIK